MTTLDTQKIEHALQVLRARTKVQSVDSMLAALERSSHPLAGQLDRSIIYKWPLRPPTRRDAVRRLLSLAEFLEGKARTTLRLGAIRSASEHLPFVLLHHASKWDREGVLPDDIDCQVEYFDSPFLCMKALSLEGDQAVDAIMAPRYAENDEEGIARFCKLIEIPVRAVFPVSYYNASQLVRALRNYGNNKTAQRGKNTAINIAMGILKNCDYETVMRNFLNGHGAFIGRTVEVEDSEFAFNALKSGLIQGVIGHKLFIDNCQDKINAVETLRKHWDKFRTTPSNFFPSIKMDIFVNKNKLSSEKAGALLKVLNAVLVHINDQKDNNRFARQVGMMLLPENLESMARQFGHDVLHEYIFEMKTFETSTLTELWK